MKTIIAYHWMIAHFFSVLPQFDITIFDQDSTVTFYPYHSFSSYNSQVVNLAHKLRTIT